MDIQIYENMMSDTPIICEQYLQQVLRLPKAQKITNITINQVIESNTALTIRFFITIKEHGHSDEKQSFFTKTIKCDSKANVYHDLSIKEAEFYKLIQNESIGVLPIARCFDVYISEDRTKYLILLQDVSDICVHANKINLLDKNVWLSAVESLARFHASFWNLKEIHSKKLPVEDLETIHSYINSTYKDFEKFKNYIGDRFDSETYAIYENAINIHIDILKELYKRKINNSNITLVHGDSHIYNFMIPTAQSIQPIIIDFQFWNVGIGVGDLAQLTRESFPDEFCKSLHQPLVRKYYKTLIEQGVQNYSWEECWNDYKKQVATMLLIPMWQYTVFGLKYDDWINDIPKLILNYKTLRCSQLGV